MSKKVWRSKNSTRRLESPNNYVSSPVTTAIENGEENVYGTSKDSSKKMF
jgi:hypothetical protein